MQEIRDIIEAYKKAVQAHLRMALATVVMVEGSSYRQPGARMLVTEDGQLTGAISGGCLEGSALQKALLAIHQQRNKLVTYDTSNEEDNDFGVQLGCNGVVHILFEPIDGDNPGNPVALLEKLLKRREEAVVVTFFSLTKRDHQPGTSLIVQGAAITQKTSITQAAAKLLNEPAAAYLRDSPRDIILAKQKKQTFLKKITHRDHQGEALIEYIAPPVSLVIAGGGNDAKPLVKAGAILGWEVRVVDGRATHALPHRFPEARQVIPGTPEQIAASVEIDPFTVFVLMTHNYEYDLAMLKYVIGTSTSYIGVLGPKAKLHRMYKDLAAMGMNLDEKQKERVYGPAGLDIGAETPAEIAISITAEIKGVLGKRNGRPLKFLAGKMHKDIPVIS